MTKATLENESPTHDTLGFKHRAYMQSADEECYICTLLRENAELKMRLGTGRLERIEAAARRVTAIADRGINCACTLKERDSGHLVDCFVPELRDAIDWLQEAVKDGRPDESERPSEGTAEPSEQGSREDWDAVLSPHGNVGDAALWRERVQFLGDVPAAGSPIVGIWMQGAHNLLAEAAELLDAQSRTPAGDSETKGGRMETAEPDDLPWV